MAVKKTPLDQLLTLSREELTHGKAEALQSEVEDVKNKLEEVVDALAEWIEADAGAERAEAKEAAGSLAQEALSDLRAFGFPGLD